MVNKSEVTDVVQDVFLSVIRMQDFARIKCPEGHLFRAAINKLRDRVRRERTLGGMQRELLLRAQMGGTESSPERWLIQREAVRHSSW